jgi:ribosomal protein L7/L12
MILLYLAIPVAVALIWYWLTSPFRSKPEPRAPIISPSVTIQDADVSDLVRQGRKLDAIIMLRERHGLNLQEAKSMVDGMDSRSDRPEYHAIDDVPPSHSQFDSSPVTSGQSHESLGSRVRQLLAEGQKIEAVKAVKNTLGLSLEESKNWVDAIDEDREANPVSIEKPNDGESEGIYAEIRALVAAGRKIDAIKHAMQGLSLGLKEAKDLVDSL